MQPGYLLTLSGRVPHLTGAETEAWREEAGAHCDALCKRKGRDSNRVLSDASHVHSGGVWLTRLDRDVLVISS